MRPKRVSVSFLALVVTLAWTGGCESDDDIIVTTGSRGHLRASLNSARLRHFSRLGTDMIESGCWYHVALVLDATDEYDDGALQAYLDGQLFGRGPGIQLPEHDDDGAVGTSVETTRFHEHQIFKGQGFRGLIDDLRIYNRALTAEEVKVLATLAPQPLAAQPPAEVDADGLEEP